MKDTIKNNLDKYDGTLGRPDENFNPNFSYSENQNNIDFANRSSDLLGKSTNSVGAMKNSKN